MAAVAGPAAAAAPASVSQTSVSQGAVGGMDTDDVDPIAEADVYMAYGRDAQAEEILKEALQKDARGIPVHAKLLEIYANRRDVKSFEQIALKLKGLTAGAGADWDKAAALGRSIDAGNGLYGGSGRAMRRCSRTRPDSGDGTATLTLTSAVARATPRPRQRRLRSIWILAARPSQAGRKATSRPAAR